MVVHYHHHFQNYGQNNDQNNGQNNDQNNDQIGPLPLLPLHRTNPPLYSTDVVIIDPYHERYGVNFQDHTTKSPQLNTTSTITPTTRIYTSSPSINPIPTSDAHITHPLAMCHNLHIISRPSILQFFSTFFTPLSKFCLVRPYFMKIITPLSPHSPLLICIYHRIFPHDHLPMV